MKNIKKSKYLVVGNFVLVNNIYCEKSKGCCGNCSKNDNPNEKNTTNTDSKTETKKEEEPKDDTVLKNKKETVKSLFEEVSDSYGKLTEEQQNRLTDKNKFENIKNEDIKNETDINNLINIENLLKNIKGNIEKIKNPEPKDAEHKDGDDPKAGPKDGGDPKVDPKVDKLKDVDPNLADAHKPVKPKVNPKEELKEVDVPKEAEHKAVDGGKHKVEPIITENKIENFDGIEHLTVELKGEYLYLYSSKNSIPFARSENKFTGEFKAENIKKTKIIFHDKFHKNSKGEKVNSVFSFEDIEGFLKNIEENNSCVLKDIFGSGKFITFKLGYIYYYDVINNYIYRLYDLKSKDGFKDKVGDKQHYFVVKEFPDCLVYFYNSNKEYGRVHLGRKEYDLYTEGKDIDEIKKLIMENPFLKKSK